MANFIQPYNNDPFVGHLSTPITTSASTRALLGNMPAYRRGLTPVARGFEIGLAHGYFLVGPFAKLGPLRNSEVGLLAGFLSALGLIVIMAVGLTIYGIASFQKVDQLFIGFQNRKNYGNRCLNNTGVTVYYLKCILGWFNIFTN